MADSSVRPRDLIRLAILATSQALRAGLRAMLVAGGEFEVVAEAATLHGLDISGADSDVIVSTYVPSPAELERAFPEVEIYPALLLLCDDPQEAAKIAELPVHAWGILSLDASSEEMAAAVHALHEGLIVGAPHLMLNRTQAGRPQEEGAAPAVYSLQPSSLQTIAVDDYLTPRETEVLQLLAQGLANKQIAVMLKISEHTVKFHVSSIYSKLGVGNRTEAVRAGVRRGLILL